MFKSEDAYIRYLGVIVFMGLKTHLAYRQTDTLYDHQFSWNCVKHPNVS